MWAWYLLKLLYDDESGDDVNGDTCMWNNNSDDGSSLIKWTTLPYNDKVEA